MDSCKKFLFSSFKLNQNNYKVAIFLTVVNSRKIVVILNVLRNKSWIKKKKRKFTFFIDKAIK